MLSANTVWLEPNTTKFPMSNLNFRKALAYAINPNQIASVIYDNIVDAANPVGLLPNLDPFIPASVEALRVQLQPGEGEGVRGGVRLQGHGRHDPGPGRLDGLELSH